MTDAPFRIVVISSCAPVHRFVLAALQKEHSISHIIRPIWCQAKGSSLKRKLGTFLRHPLASLYSRINEYYSTWVYRSRDTYLNRTLRSPSVAELGIPCSEVPWHDINSDNSRKLLDSLKPQVMIVLGAPILSEDIVGVASIAAVNVHYGIAPMYRGEESIFWARYHGDIENIGVTLHHLAKKVDSGTLISRRWQEVDYYANEFDIWAKCASLAAIELTTYLNYVRSLSSKSVTQGVAQEDSIGHNYRRSERTLWKEVKFRLGCFFRNVFCFIFNNPKKTVSRVERYY